MKNTLKDEFYRKGRFEHLKVYDMHGHMGPVYGIHLPKNDSESMVLDMDRSGVKMLVFCHHEALMSAGRGNKSNIEAVRKHPDRLRAYCGINPNYPETVKKELKSFGLYYKNTFVGFKFIADYHRYAITDISYKQAWEMADDMGLLVLLHTWGGSMYNGPETVREVAKKYRNAKILLGHSCHGAWDKAITLVKDFPNTYLELCAVLDERGVLEKMVGELGADRIIFGTDFPWFSYNYYIGAVLGAEIDDADRIKILSSNAEKLLAPHIA